MASRSRWSECAQLLSRNAFSPRLYAFKLEATPVYAQCKENQPALPTVKIDDKDLRWFSLHPVPSVGLPAPIVRLLKTLGNDA